MLARIAPEQIERARSLLEGARSANTKRAYASDWYDFQLWCEAARLSSLPAEPGTVALYLSDLSATAKPSTVQRRKATIALEHRRASHVNPCDSAVVREMWTGIARKYGTKPAHHRAITPDDLARMVAVTRDRSAGLRAIRDCAVLLLGFFGAFRRSELVALRIDDIDFESRGMLVRVTRSKTDAEGVGLAKPIVTQGNRALCAVENVRRWIDAAQVTEGPVFRPISSSGSVGPGELDDRRVWGIVKLAAKRAGLPPEDFGAHSLRAGLATEAAKRGASVFAIMEHTGHRTARQLEEYVRLARNWESNVTRGIFP